MSAATIPIGVSALHEILKWSAERPHWQRDALRRVIVQETIEDSDVEHFDRLCRAQYKMLEDGQDPPLCDPLSASHLPPAPGAESSVVVISLGTLQHVNRLPINQTIEFGGAPGLSIVYGDNGAGKSGYARVLKKACRSRGAPPIIKPNAYKAKPTVPATAKLVCAIGGVETPLDWTDGDVGDSRLANVFTFDGSCAAHYLTDDGPASFTPHGLDILPKLSNLCDRVRERIQKDIATANAIVDATRSTWKPTPTTLVGKLLASLSDATKVSDIEAIAVFTAADKERLKQLNEILKSNAKQKAKESRASATRLRSAAEHMVALCNGLCGDEVAALRKHIESVLSADRAAKAFSEGRFDATFLPGTGGDLWRALWNAAESYSTSKAYPQAEFPNTAADALCLLCQQPMDDDARKRFAAFAEFCKDQSLEIAATARKALAAASAKINAIKPLAPELAKIEADLDGVSDAECEAIRAYVQISDARLTACKSALSELNAAALVEPPPAVHPSLVARADLLEQRATTEESADDPGTRAKLSAERDELADREWLVSAKDDVLKQLLLLMRSSLLKECQKDTSTNAITLKNGELTKQIVTDAFCKQFEDEVKALGLRTISVEMQEIKGRKGETRFGLRLKGADGHNVHEVASEGEQRCIGIAAFLAELSQSSHQSALVFDDPVSSLDHWHRERIAARLVNEAVSRQVIVFTHETTFLNDLVEHSAAAGIEPHCRYLEWSGDEPGKCCEGLPWDHKPPEERLKHLDECLKELRATWATQPTEANRSEMKTAYSKLRNTVERVVEHVVLADVVFRFRRKIAVSSLTKVLGLSQTECDEVLRLYQRCHNLIDGHDSPSGLHVAPPEPDDLDKDIAATKKLIEVIRNRRDVAAKAAKAAAAPPSSVKAAGGSPTK